jgi:hypothetical protein
MLLRSKRIQYLDTTGLRRAKIKKGNTEAKEIRKVASGNPEGGDSVHLSSSVSSVTALAIRQFPSLSQAA